ncbi:MAG TPA: DUF4157 domain-containing protein [Pyrinomonadaceae bacterium]|nr:DUF4157 domain-containing protein [Pyrinomonadaceae bacterium]
MYDNDGNYVGAVVTQPFQAFADGYSGFMTAGTSYVGDGVIFNSWWTGGASEKVRFDDIDDDPMSLAGFFVQQPQGARRKRKRSKRHPTGGLGGKVGGSTGTQVTETRGLTEYMEVGDSRGGSKIAPCAKYILNQIGVGKFVNLDDIRIHIGIPEAIMELARRGQRFGAVIPKALTFGKDIYYATPDDYRPTTLDGIALLGHELEHVRQYLTLGEPAFLMKYYLLEGARKGYDNIDLEIFADRVQNAVRNRVKSDYGETPCK